MLIKFFCVLGKYLDIIFSPITLRFVTILNIMSSGRFSASVKNNPKRIFVANKYDLKGGKYVSIGDGFIGNSGLIIEALDKFGKQIFEPHVSIGTNTFFNKNCRIQCINKIEIGDNVMLGGNVFITDHYHGNPLYLDYLAPAKRPLFSKGPVVIHNSVWIGEGVVIMPNVEIGEGAIIGANAVVTKNVTPFTIVGGNPAKLIRSLKTEIA